MVLVRVGVALLTLAPACTETAQTRTVPSAPEAQAPAGAADDGPVLAAPPTADLTSGPVAVTGGAGPTVQLQFDTISRLHKGFFGQEAPLAALAGSMAVCGGTSVDVQIRWHRQTRVGQITGVLPPGSPCTPVRRHGALDLAPLIPFTTALADYRDAVAGSSDFRIASFQVRARWSIGARTCVVRAAGQHPPDGTRFAPCLLTGDATTCTETGAGDGVVRLDGSEAGSCGISR